MDRKRGHWKGATSKNVKNRQKVSKIFSTFFDNLCVAPVFRPFWVALKIVPIIRWANSEISEESLPLALRRYNCPLTRLPEQSLPQKVLQRAKATGPQTHGEWGEQLIWPSGTDLSGHYSRDWSESVNVIRAISEPFTSEFRERIVNIMS